MIIQGGLVALPGADTPERADIRIADGIITEIARPGGVSDGDRSVDEEVIDADGLLVLPGAIDPHVHFDEPGYTDREDFYHGTSSAAQGGVTTVIDMPCTSVPPVTSAANLREKLAVVSQRAVIDFGFYGGVSGNSFDAYGSTATAGSARAPVDTNATLADGAYRGAADAVDNRLLELMRELAPDVLGFKCYLVSGMETFPAVTMTQLAQVLAAGRQVDRPILVHAEDPALITGPDRRGSEGREQPPAATVHQESLEDGPSAYYRSRPETAEISAIAQAVVAAERAGARLHIVHVSTGEGARIIGTSRFSTGETGPHYLAFTLDDFRRIGSPLKVTPPVKPAPNNSALWDALIDGTLAFVASDHAPAPADQKNTGSIWTDYAGIPGSPTLLPYLFSAGYRTGRLSLSRLVEVTSRAAARQYGLSGKGSLEVGYDGDCVLLDPDASWTVRGGDLLSKGPITPFDGMTLTGRVEKTIVRGTVVYDRARGIVVSPGHGQFQRKNQRGEQI